MLSSLLLLLLPFILEFVICCSSVSVRGSLPYDLVALLFFVVDKDRIILSSPLMPYYTIITYHTTAFHAAIIADNQL